MSLYNKYSIVAGIIPSVRIQVSPEQTVMTQTGAYLAGSPRFQQKTERFRSQSGSGLSTLLSGEGLFVNKFTNKGPQDEEIIFSNEEVGVVVPISKELETGILCNRRAFFAATSQIDIGFKQVRDLALASLTKQPLFMQFCKKSDPNSEVTMFLASASTPVEIVLENGDVQIVDNKSLFAMTEGVKLRMYENTGLKRALAGGEGKFMTVAEGPGKIWIAPPKAKQSANRIINMLEKLIPG